MKFLANFLVNIHGAAAAEAMCPAAKAGLPLLTVYKTLHDNAATSHLDMFLKDLDVVSAFAVERRHSVALFATAMQYYVAVSGAGTGALDVAASYRLFEGLSPPLLPNDLRSNKAQA